MHGRAQGHSKGNEGDESQRAPATPVRLSADESREVLLRYANDSVLLLDADFRLIDCNDRTLEVFGYAREELLGRGVDAVRAEQPDMPLEKRLAALRRVDATVFESVGRRKDGSVFPIETSLRAVDTEHGRLYHATIRDITERATARAELRRSHALLSEAEGAADIGYWTWDRETDVLTPSALVLRLAGVDPGSPTLEADLSARVLPEDADDREQMLRQVKQGVPVTFAFRVRSPGGDDRYVEGMGRPLFDEHAELVGASGIVMDVTERRAADLALRESEERYRLLFASMMEGFAYCRMVYDAEGHPSDWLYLSVNPAFGLLTGIDDAAGRYVTELFPSIKADNPELFEVYGHVAETGDPADFDIDFAPLGKWLHVSVTRPREGEFVAFFYDISEQVAASLQLVEAREALSRSLDSANMATWDWDVAGGGVTWSEASWDLYGIDRDGREPSFELWLESIHPDDRERVSQLAWRGAHEGLEHEIEWRVNTQDGSERWLLSRGGPRFDAEGRVTDYGGVVFDVTERRAAERRASDSERRLRLSLEAADAGTWEWDLGTGRNTWSEETWRLYDLDASAGEATYERWLEAIAPEDRGIAAASVAAAVAAGKEIDLEYRVDTRDGSPRWIISRGSPEHDDDGDIVRYLGVVVDVTERKLATIAARERGENYSAVFDESPFAMSLMRGDGSIVDTNEAFLDMVKAPREDVVGRSAAELRIAEPEALAGVAERLRREGVVRDLELERLTVTGDRLVVSLSLRFIRIAGEELVLGIYRDITEQKRAEEAVQEVRARLDAALESMTDAVFISDAEGTFVEFNEAFAAFHRFPDKESCAKTLADYPGFLDVFLDTGQPAPLDMWAVPRALRGEVAVDAEYGLRRKDTGEEWVGSYSFGPIRNDGGEVVGSVVVARDITERKQMERALRHSEADAREAVSRLSLAQEIGHMGDWDWDVATGSVRWSEEVYRIYGVPPSFLTDFATITRMIHPEDVKAHLRRVQEFIDDAETSASAFSFRIVRPTGDVRHIFQTAAAERDEEGRPTRLFGIQQDVTEVRETEQALVESERRFRRSYDAGLVGVVFWTAEGGITDANDRFLQMLGYTRDELVAGVLDWVALTPPAYAARDQESLEELRTTGRNAVPYEKEYYRKDGSRLPVLITAATLGDEGTTGVGLVLDISEQKRAEEELRRLNLELEDRVRRRTADLEAANAELESFSYSVSHDLRAPLRHIAGFAQLLDAELGDGADGDVGHFLERIRCAATDMSTLIDDLLDFSRVGRAEMHVVHVDMAALVAEVLEVQSSELGERRVEVTVGEVLPARGDRILLRQVWANVVSNAFKYTRPRDPARIEIDSRLEDGRIVYWVRDNGVGFDMEYADRMFRVFERLHRAEEFEGTGIGLANVQRILGRHDGSCWAEAEPDRGATFYFSLPSG
jgi:PAS domain S-box-containing protein